MKKNGFTLIELLAVIVILAIIALIAVPIVLQIINDAKDSSQEESMELYAKAVENAIVNYYMKHPDKTSVTKEELEKENLINYSGEKVECDIVNIYGNRKLYISECKVGDVEVDYEYAEPVENMLYHKKHVKVEQIDDDETGEGETQVVFSNNYNYEFLNTGIQSKKIDAFEIKTSGTNIENLSEYESKDCSYNQDKSVMCYWKASVENNGYYNMIIAANGEVYAPYDSSGLFFNFGYDKLEKLNLTGLNTKYAANMREMFAYAGRGSMTTFNIGSTFDTSNVIDMTSMFYAFGLLNMQELSLGNKFDTSNVIKMHGMFNGAGFGAITSLDLGDKFDTSNVYDMEYMFNCTGTYSMESLNLGDKFDTSKVTNMSSMFRRTGHKKMTSLDLGDKFDIPNSSTVDGMFYYCGKNTGNSEDIIIYVKSQSLKDKIRNLDYASVPNLWKTNDNIIQVQSN